MATDTIGQGRAKQKAGALRSTFKARYLPRHLVRLRHAAGQYLGRNNHEA